MTLLETINDPADLRKLPRTQLKDLAGELRAYVLDSVSKTGALLQGSVLMGAACGMAPAPARDALAEYGAAIGLAFQVVDDILDVTADSATLGKTAGKDAAQDKPTYVSVLGLAGARRFAGELLQEALQALPRSGLQGTQALQALAAMVVNRDN